MEATQSLSNVVELPAMNNIQFEELESMIAPVDPWVAGFIVGGSFGAGLAIGAGIAIAT